MNNNKSVQKFVDRVLENSFLRFIPRWIRPNYFTLLRLLSVPIIYYLLRLGKFPLALVIFGISAFTDAIDGALARTRNQVTGIGEVFDPIADKLLIGAVLLYIGPAYWIVTVFLIFIAIEIIGIFLNLALAEKLGEPLPANKFGKIKMVLQTVCIVLFLLGFMLSSSTLIVISEYILIVALGFAIVSSYIQTKNRLTTKKRP